MSAGSKEDEQRGLATLSRGDFMKLVYGDDLTNLLKATKPRPLTTRNLFEISTATTQCNNIIGQCDKPTCKCWICGFPIFLDEDGNARSQDFIDKYIESGKKATRVKFISNEKMNIDLLPQCEHILPVMQAFFILGGLYWNETYEQQSKYIKELLDKEYAWSHAYCNNIKDDTNLFDDEGNIRVDIIKNLLIRIYAKVEPIRKKVQDKYGGTNKNAPTKWIKDQTASMIKEFLDPLANVYKKTILGEQANLEMLASLAVPIQHIEVNLREFLPENHNLVVVMDQYKPEEITPLSIPDWKRKWEEKEISQLVLPELFSKDIYKGLFMPFIQHELVGIYTYATEELSKSTISNKGLITKNLMQFLNYFIHLTNCVGDRPNPRKFKEEYIPECTKNAIMMLIPEDELYAIIVLVNKFIPINQAAYILNIVQAYVLYKMLIILNTNSDILDIRNELRDKLQNKTIDNFIHKLNENMDLAIEILTKNQQFNTENSLIWFILGKMAPQSLGVEAPDDIDILKVYGMQSSSEDYEKLLQFISKQKNLPEPEFNEQDKPETIEAIQSLSTQDDLDIPSGEVDESNVVNLVEEVENTKKRQLAQGEGEESKSKVPRLMSEKDDTTPKVGGKTRRHPRRRAKKRVLKTHRKLKKHPRKMTKHKVKRQHKTRKMKKK